MVDLGVCVLFIYILFIFVSYDVRCLNKKTETFLLQRHLPLPELANSQRHRRAQHFAPL